MLLKYTTSEHSPNNNIVSDGVSAGRKTNAGSSSNLRLDANDVAFFGTELQEFDPVVYETIKADLLAMQIFPIKYCDAGAEVVSYDMITATGKAKYKTSKSGNTPLVNVTKKRYPAYLASLDVAYEFTNQDMRAARMSQSQSTVDPLIELRDQAMRACMETMDNTCFVGDKELGLEGIVTTSKVGSSAPVGVAWATATADQIYADLQTACDSITNTTLNKLQATDCLISLALFNQIQDQRYNTYTGQSIMDVFKARKNITFTAVPELNNAFTGAKDGFIFFRKSPLCIQHLVAVMFETTAPQQTGWTETVYCQSRHGGLIIRHPQTIARRYMP